MSETWSHAELGSFTKSEHDRWVMPLKVEGFDQFTVDEPPELEIEGPDEGLPTEAQCQKALEFLEHAGKLGPAILSALWTDIQGGDVDSGHWWHGGLEELNDNFIGALDDDGPIETIEDLAKSLSFGGIAIGLQHETAIEVCFYCDWEAEHGVSALVDGDRVIGLGYAYDLEPFEGEPWPPRDDRPPVRNPFTGEMH